MLQVDVVLMQDDKGTVFVGKVWPGYTAYPDFLNPNTTIYWEKQVSLLSITYSRAWGHYPEGMVLLQGDLMYCLGNKVVGMHVQGFIQDFSKRGRGGGGTI